MLSKNDAGQFFRLMWGLQFHVSRKKALLPHLKSREDYERLARGDKIVVRDALWENPDLIDAYVRENPDGLPPEELAIIGKWKGFVADKFYVFRYLKDHAIFISGSKVYGVAGLFDPLEEVFGGQPLPIMTEAVLLPYKGKIIYDGLFRPYGLFFGAGIRADLKEIYLTAKQNGRIIISLEPDTAEDPVQLPRKTNKENEAIVVQIMRASKRLKGGAAIQEAAFGLLRAGAKTAQAAVQGQDAVEELWRLGRKAQNALNHLYNTLKRARR